MQAFLLVGLGGAVGAMARYGVGRLFGATGLPWATLTVNMVGGLLMGLLVGVLAALSGGGESARLLLGVGVLGGFTTFSAFSLELMLMLERGQLALGLGYAVASVLLSAGALAAGLWLTRAFVA